MSEEKVVTHKYASITEFYQKEEPLSSTAKVNSKLAGGDTSEVTCVNKAFHLRSH
jgi:hypothetical protein